MTHTLQVLDGGPTVTDEDLDLVRATVARNATPEQLKLYLYDCRRQRVHPLDNLLHCTIRGGKYVPITSIDLMRSRAAETGEYAGQDDAVIIWNTLGDTPYPEAATVSVYRIVQGQRVAFVATARWNEYKPDNYAGLWGKMPSVMISKCAEALALRKGFPTQLAGLYEQAELDQAIVSGEAAHYPDPEEPVGRPTEIHDVDAPPPGESDERPGKQINDSQLRRLFAILKASKHERFAGVDFSGRKVMVGQFVDGLGYAKIEALRWTGKTSADKSDYDTVVSWIGPS